MKPIKAITYICLIVIMSLMAGCATKPYNIDQQTDGFQNISTKNRICVTTPQDGRFEAAMYHGSGDIVAKKTAGALRDKFSNVIIVTKQSSRENLEACRTASTNYVVEPTIVHWEDRATGWSGKPDIVKIHLKAYEIGLIDDSVELTFENKRNVTASAFFEWGNFKPESLLDENYEKAVRSLFP